MKVFQSSLILRSFQIPAQGACINLQKSSMIWDHLIQRNAPSYYVATHFVRLFFASGVKLQLEKWKRIGFF